MTIGHERLLPPVDIWQQIARLTYGMAKQVVIWKQGVIGSFHRLSYDNRLCRLTYEKKRAWKILFTGWLMTTGREKFFSQAGWHAWTSGASSLAQAFLILPTPSFTCHDYLTVNAPSLISLSQDPYHLCLSRTCQTFICYTPPIFLKYFNYICIKLQHFLHHAYSLLYTHIQRISCGCKSFYPK